MRPAYQDIQISASNHPTPRTLTPDSMPSLLVETEFIDNESLYMPTSKDSLLPYSSPCQPESNLLGMHSFRSPSTNSYSTSISRPVSIASSASFPASAQSNPSLDSLCGYGTSAVCTTPAQTPQDISFDGNYFSTKCKETPVDVLWADLETQLGQGLTPRLAPLPPIRPAKSPARYSTDSIPLLGRTSRLDSEVELAQMSLRADQSMEEGELDLMIGRALLSESIMDEEEVTDMLEQEKTKRKDRLQGNGRPQSGIQPPTVKSMGRQWSDSYVPALDMVLDWSCDTRLPSRTKARPVSVPALKIKSGLPRSASGSNPASPSTPKARVPSTPRSRIPSSPSKIPSAPSSPTKSSLPTARIPSASSSPRKIPSKLAVELAEAEASALSPLIRSNLGFHTTQNNPIPSSPAVKPASSRWSLASAIPASPVESKLPRLSSLPALPINPTAPSGGPFIAPSDASVASPKSAAASNGLSSWFGFRRAADLGESTNICQGL